MRWTLAKPPAYPADAAQLSPELKAWWEELEGWQSGIHDKLCEIAANTSELLKFQQRKDPRREWYPIGSNPVKLQTLGYRHSYIFVGAAQVLNVDPLGIPISLNLAAGWNPLNLPDGTLLTATTSFNAILLLSDDTQPSA